MAARERVNRLQAVARELRGRWLHRHRPVHWPASPSRATSRRGARGTPIPGPRGSSLVLQALVCSAGLPHTGPGFTAHRRAATGGGAGLGGRRLARTYGCVHGQSIHEFEGVRSRAGRGETVVQELHGPPLTAARRRSYACVPQPPQRAVNVSACGDGEPRPVLGLPFSV